MSDADLLGVMTIALCLGGSMFFSGSESAIMTYGEHNARRALEEADEKPRGLAAWVDHPVQVLSTILIGNNIVNTLLGSMVTAMAIRHLAGGQYSDWAVPLAVTLATALVLVFGEILPKAFGRLYSHRVSLPALAVLDVIGRVLWPGTWLFTKLTNTLINRTQSSESMVSQRVTSDALDYLVKVGQREGSIPADQAALLRGIFRFEDKVVRDIMVPKDRVTAIDLAWEPSRILELAHASGHSRMPLYEDNLDNIRGVLHIKSLVGKSVSGRIDLTRLARPPMFVSESLLIQDLLQRFREKRVHLAIVVDDGGRTVGVVTLEDVLEQIVGQIFDESDRVPAGGGATEIEGIHFLDGQASLRRVEELFGVEYEEFDGVDSVGDLLCQLAGQMPIAGSVFVYDGVRFKVLAADDRHVIRVSAELVEVEDDD